MAQSRYYLQTFDPKVGTICILGALGVHWDQSTYYLGTWSLNPKPLSNPYNRTLKGTPYRIPLKEPFKGTLLYSILKEPLIGSL